MKTAPCKRREAAIIMVPFHFTSVETGNQLCWSGGRTESRRGAAESVRFYTSPSQNATELSSHMQHKSVRGDFICCLYAVQNDI